MVVYRGEGSKVEAQNEKPLSESVVDNENTGDSPMVDSAAVQTGTEVGGAVFPAYQSLPWDKGEDVNNNPEGGSAMGEAIVVWDSSDGVCDVLEPGEIVEVEHVSLEKEEEVETSL